MTIEVDILVVGLGPAGASAAAAAAEAGCSVLAVDRKSSAGEPVQCAELVTGMIGPEFGDMRQVIDQDIARMVTYVEDEPPHVTDPFPGHMIDRAAFDQSLITAAQALGVQCRFGTGLREITPQGAVLSDGEQLTARLIIGADGPRSKVAAAVGQSNTELVEARQITVPLSAPHDATDIYLSGTIPGGYGWLFPKADVAHIGIGVDSRHRHLLAELLNDLHQRLIEEGRVGETILKTTGGAIPVGGLRQVLTRIGSCPVLLAGDAAGLANPVTGAGINSAVISGRMAGEAAAQWCAGDNSALDEYGEEIESLFGTALARAKDRRAEITAVFDNNEQPSAEQMRRSWIAFDAYWHTLKSQQPIGERAHVLSEA